MPVGGSLEAAEQRHRLKQLLYNCAGYHLSLTMKILTFLYFTMLSSVHISIDIKNCYLSSNMWVSGLSLSHKDFLSLCKAF